MPPPTADKLCCTADQRTDSPPMPNARDADPNPAPKLDPQPQTRPGPRRRNSTPALSTRTLDLQALQQIFAEAGAAIEPERATNILVLQHPRAITADDDDAGKEESVSADAAAGPSPGTSPKKKNWMKRLTRDLSKSSMNLLNPKKAKAGEKSKGKGMIAEGDEDVDKAVELELADRAKQASPRDLLGSAYDSDAASLPDIRDSVVDRLTRSTLFEDGDGGDGKSPVRRRSMERRIDLMSVEWHADDSYGWNEPRVIGKPPLIPEAPPQSSSDLLGVLPSCSSSATNLRHGDTFKTARSQRPRSQSDSPKLRTPATPALQPTRLSSLSSSVVTGLFVDAKDEVAMPLTEGEHVIHEEEVKEKHDVSGSSSGDGAGEKGTSAVADTDAEISQWPQLGNTTTTSSDYDLALSHEDRSSEAKIPYRTSTAAQEPEQDDENGHERCSRFYLHQPPPLHVASPARTASFHGPSSSRKGSEEASLHLYQMRISQHLRSGSSLSGISRATSTTHPSHARPGASSAPATAPASRTTSGPASERASTRISTPRLGSGPATAPAATASSRPSFLSKPPDYTNLQRQQSVKRHKRHASSSGFASDHVPETWGSVVPGGDGENGADAGAETTYAPSSVYSTRTHSLGAEHSTPAASARDGDVGGSKSGYEVLELADVSVFRFRPSEDIPGYFPTSPAPMGENGEGGEMEATTARDRKGKRPVYKIADGLEDEAEKTKRADKGKRPLYKCSEVAGTAATEPAKEGEPNAGPAAMSRSSSPDIPPVALRESQAPGSQARTPQPVTDTGPSLPTKKSSKNLFSPWQTPHPKPAPQRHTKKFSTFSFFRSKTCANLRRASHNAASTSNGEPATSSSPTSSPAAPGSEKEHGRVATLDGPTDVVPASSPTTSSPEEHIEMRRPGRLARAWQIGNGRDELGGGGSTAVWERALKAHRDEKSALFLSPEKGGTAGEAGSRSLFRERSGSGSALRAKATMNEGDSGKTDKSKMDRSKSADADLRLGFDFGGFGGGGSLNRSPTVLLDPLDSMERATAGDMARRKELSSVSGGELYPDAVSSAIGVSRGTSLMQHPSIDTLPRAKNWADSTASDMDLGDLGAWSRYPSHTREGRTGAAGDADDVHARDFAYEIQLCKLDDASSNDEDNARDTKRGGSLKKKTKARTGLPKSKSMTFGRGFLKHYLGMFRSQSQDFRRYGHGHRSSVAEGGILEHPELEILPPVFSPTLSVPMEPIEPIELQARNQFDGADSSTCILPREGDWKKPVLRVEFDLPKEHDRPRRSERKTDSSAESWKTNARLWSRLYGSGILSDEREQDKARAPQKTDSSMEWKNNARLWTRFGGSSQDQAQDEKGYPKEQSKDNDIEQKELREPEESTEPRSKLSSEDAWRSDARLFSQLYDSCIPAPQFSGSEAGDGGEAHGGSHTARPGLRVASTGNMDGIVVQVQGHGRGRSDGGWRSLSGSLSGYGGRQSDDWCLSRSGSVVSVSRLRASAQDLVKLLQESEDITTANVSES